MDIAWIFYGGNAWNGVDNNTWLHVLHQTVFIVGIVELIGKIGSIILIFISEKENIVNSLPEAVKGIFSKL